MTPDSVEGGRTTQDAMNTWPVISDSEEEWDEDDIEGLINTTRNHPTMEISLGDIARPAKPRGKLCSIFRSSKVTSRSFSL